MNSLTLHQRVTQDYKDYINSFINIKDARIRKFVEEKFDADGILPEPLIQFNPSYLKDESIQDLVIQKLVHPEIPRVLGSFKLFKHQVEAIKQGVSDKGFIVTSGTGSGKSLTYLATVFNRIFNHGDDDDTGIAAILVYPMNALINSQEEEIMRYEINYHLSFLPEKQQAEFDPKLPENKDLSTKELLAKVKLVSSAQFPIRYNKYTGQESKEQKKQVEHNRPQVILTNYMMLEMIMTREAETWMRQRFQKSLKYLVLDELHTYRGRQGSDVSMLVRRLSHLSSKEIIGIGTSATMATEGGLEEKKEAVAKVGRTIFGQDYGLQQIISEHLETYTDFSVDTSAKNIIDSFSQSITENNFSTHPLCVWLEKEIALIENEPGFLERNRPSTITDIAEKLSAVTGSDIIESIAMVNQLLSQLEALNQVGSKKKPKRSFLPFRFHQFISQTSTVYTTLDRPEDRQLTLEIGRYIKDQTTTGDRFIYPLLFSRHSGHEFICVRKNYETNQLEPRDPDDIQVHITKDDLKGDRETGRKKRQLDEDELTEGYILFDHAEDEPIWNEEEIAELPDTWWREVGGVPTLENYYEYRVPQPIYLSRSGDFSKEKTQECSIAAWYVPAKLLFDPTAGVIYDLKTKENTKLMQLGNEGRSTATTITAFSVIKELMRQKQPTQIQKLLSFTDNRQDASLQSGHFNDFIATIRLRSALFNALENAPEQTLKVYDIAKSVFDSLGVEETEYAREPNPDFPDPENRRAIEKFLLVRVLRDLKRGWRYNLPNLEQAGLLEIDFDRLEEFSKVEKFFTELPLFSVISPDERAEIFSQILNYFRTSYAIQAPILDDERNDAESFMNAKLDPDKYWSPDRNERIEIPSYLTYINPGKTKREVFINSAGPMSYLGKYIKRLFLKHGLEPLNRDSYYEYCEKLFQTLKKGNFLKETEIKGDKATTPGYRLRVDNMLWKPGNGTTTWHDSVRNASYKELNKTPNLFFQDLYKLDFANFDKNIIGSEHTGQLKSDDRIDRESKFRKGDISSLFCSPTMELGIDIAELNIVHMRNVPPNPANYAQRSGRAGRSGQTAVVFTYCSNRSPHDRNYFGNPIGMVSGSVVPPRIDLINEELIATHLNAFILMKLSIKEMHSSVRDILDTNDKVKLPIKQEIQNYIDGRLEQPESFIEEFRKIIINEIGELEKSDWFTTEWLQGRVRNFKYHLDKSLDRWRILLKNADEIIRKARIIMDDPTVKQSSPEMKESKRMHKVGLAQRGILLNDGNNTFGNASEFYIFRYLASEGFLPGYNFTRLPVRTFAGYKFKEEGEYISRSRFIALKEFGPNNLIYHNGNKYRIDRMFLPDASLQFEHATISNETNYIFLGESGKGANNDPITNNPLDSTSKVLKVSNLVELSETEAIPQERISCEEEERMSTGFDIQQYFHYPKGISSTKQATINVGGSPLLNLIYCPATQLVKINHKWRKSKDANGFLVHDQSGKWLKKADRDNPEIAEHAKEAKIFTHDTTDTLYIQPVEALGLEPEQVISLAYALMRGIEEVFQVEESEVGIWIMGSDEHPNIMIYESSEGSLGVISQLIESSTKLKEVYIAAYRKMHFDPASREDTAPETPKATYDDLLSYYNQPHHDSLDRFSIKDALEQLIDSEIDLTTIHGNREKHYQFLIQNYDKNSATERALLAYLYENKYALPDRAQVNLEDYYINADFVYDTNSGPVYLFCDGSIHTRSDIAKQDAHKREKMFNAGLDVIVWAFDERSNDDIKESISHLIEKRKDIFRKL